MSDDQPFRVGDRVRHIDATEVETVVRCEYQDIGLGWTWRLLTISADGRACRWMPADEFVGSR